MAILTFRGVRGSGDPINDTTSGGFGRKTTCVHVDTGLEHIIIDAGTGIVSLGEELMREEPKKPQHLFFTHYHNDHISGIHLYEPLFNPQTTITAYGEEKVHFERRKRMGTYDLVAVDMSVTPLSVINRCIGYPYWPRMLAAKISEHIVDGYDPEIITLGAATMMPVPLRHQQGSVGYILETNGVKSAFLWDHEHGNSIIDRNLESSLVGTDIIVMDSAYTSEEYATRAGWGHSTNIYAARLAAHVGAKLLVLMHHDPAHNDFEIHKMMQDASYIFPDTVAACEGMTMDLSCEQSINRKVG